MKNRLLSKFVVVATLALTMISTVVFPVNKVEASSTEVTQSTINLTNLIREDNTIRFTIPENIKIKDITYERVYEDEGQILSDLIVESNLQKGFGNNEYTFEVDPNTVGVKIWKVKHQEQVNYYKNKFTTGTNSVGNLDSVSKRNYVTVTADKLESYEFACKEFDMPWYLWSPVGIAYKTGDYLFNREYCASYTWYFSLDIEIDKIESLSLEYATFTYTEALWGVLESKHDYKNHQVTVNSEDTVYDYKKFTQYAHDVCYNLSACNNALYEKGQEYFQHKAFGVSDEEGFDWYVQVSLNDLLRENNVLWGAYENHDYLQEVSLVKISYWFDGEYYEDIPVLDEDTGELIVKADDSPIDLLVKFLDNSKTWIEENVPVLLAIGGGILFVICLPMIIRFLTYIESGLSSLNKREKNESKVNT